jgi:hypothetical protein
MNEKNGRMAHRRSKGMVAGWWWPSNYRHQIVLVKWIGTHGDYDKVDVNKVKYGHQAH